MTERVGEIYVEKRIKESVHHFISDAFARAGELLLRFLREVWRNRSDGQHLKWLGIFLGSLAFATSLRMVYTQMIGSDQIEFNRALMGLCFPFIFCIKKREWRNVILTVAIMSAILSRQWIGIYCISITYFFIIAQKNKVLGVLFLAVILSLSMASKQLIKTATPIDDTQERMAIYQFTLSKWKNIAWGHGLNSFQKLPENQPNVRKDKKLQHHPHSELICSLFELGVYVTIGLTFVMLLPLLWSRVDILMISHLCLVLQSLIDFPLHRVTTGLVALIILTLAYSRNCYDKRDLSVFEV